MLGYQLSSNPNSHSLFSGTRIFGCLYHHASDVIGAEVKTNVELIVPIGSVVIAMFFWLLIVFVIRGRKKVWISSSALCQLWANPRKGKVSYKKTCHTPRDTRCGQVWLIKSEQSGSCWLSFVSWNKATLCWCRSRRHAGPLLLDGNQNHWKTLARYKKISLFPHILSVCLSPMVEIWRQGTCPWSWTRRTCPWTSSANDWHTMLTNGSFLGTDSSWVRTQQQSVPLHQSWDNPKVRTVKIVLLMIFWLWFHWRGPTGTGGFWTGGRSSCLWHWESHHMHDCCSQDAQGLVPSPKEFSFGQILFFSKI